MDKLIKEAGIVKIDPKNCACTKNSYVYRIPNSIGVEILEFLKPLGTPAISFEKTSLLRIENGEFAITGVKRLKEIRFSLKKSEKTNLLAIFEEALINYVGKFKK